MTFKWQEYLTLAQHLAKCTIGCSTEAQQRSAVSRAYYAAYRHARDYAETKEGFIVKRRGDHSNLIKHYCDNNNHPIEEKLKDLLTWRHQCDYEENVGDLPKLVANSIISADFIFANLK
jgi:uncharacterized protein (UPF0332 family)